MDAQPNTAPAIDARSLTAGYRTASAVTGLNLEVFRGEVFAFVGPNGIGKTTLLRLLTGDLRPASGSVSVLGLDPERAGAGLRSRTGVLIEDVEAMGALTARDVLWLCASVRDCDLEYAEKLADRLGVDVDRPIGEMSAGQRRALGVVQALMHEPELVILDETTAALDPVTRRELFALLREVAVRGATVVLTAHDLDEVAAVADRVAVLRAYLPATIVTITARAAVLPRVPVG